MSEGVRIASATLAASHEKLRSVVADISLSGEKDAAWVEGDCDAVIIRDNVKLRTFC